MLNSSLAPLKGAKNAQWRKNSLFNKIIRSITIHKRIKLGYSPIPPIHTHTHTEGEREYALKT
jgi:hypothetical protein